MMTEHAFEREELQDPDEIEVEVAGNMGTMSGFGAGAELHHIDTESPPDRRIVEQVQTLLPNDSLIKPGTVSIEAHDGKVTLHGVTLHPSAPAQFEERVRLIAGVKDVRNQLEVEVPSEP